MVRDRIVMGMAGLRMLSSAIEFSAALLMLHFNRVEDAFRSNAVLAMVGPSVMLTVTTLGLIGLAGKISTQGIFIVMTGVALIFLGVSRV